MKKFISLALALLMVIPLFACNGKNDEASETSAPKNTAAVVETNAGNVTDAAVTDEPNEATPEPVEATAMPTGEETLEEALVYDADDIRISVTGLDKKALFGPEVKLLIENNSEKDLTFQVNHVSVNGYMVDAIMSTDVNHGKKANTDFSLSDLDECGISTIADIEVSFHVFDSESWDTYVDTDTITLNTSAQPDYEYTFDDSGELLYEDNIVRIVSKGFSAEDSLFGKSLMVYIENKTDKAITVQTRDESVNGFMVDAIFSSTVLPGKRAVDGITFSDTSLEENKIEEITDVELSFHVYDEASFDTLVDTDAIKLAF